MADETPALEELKRHAYLSSDREIAALVVGMERNGTTRIHYHEFNFATGELLTPKSAFFSDFKREGYTLARPRDLSNVKYDSNLFRELQNRGLVHSVSVQPAHA